MTSTYGQCLLIDVMVQSSGWQQPEFCGVLGGRMGTVASHLLHFLFVVTNAFVAGVIGGSLPNAKQHQSPHFIKAQSIEIDSRSKNDSAVEPMNIVSLSCNVTDGFLSLAAWVRNSCAMYFPVSFFEHCFISNFTEECPFFRLNVLTIESLATCGFVTELGRWVESTHVSARVVVLVYGQQSSVTLLR